jgi:2-phospho-L-lactate/phosphoenolpyruvate guanylyltransferase
VTIVVEQMRTAAILPVKRFARAKRRLGESVADRLRVELAGAMVADVLLALAQTRSIDRTIVVTGEESVAAAAREQGALVLPDADEEGQSAAVTFGIRAALAQGLDRALCIPGDCPALEPAELESLLAPARGRYRAGGRGAELFEPELVIVPDRHGTGTNGLLLTPPDVIAPSFGADSCERHRALALAAGVGCRIERPASLLLDIDTGADLAELRERLSEAGARAGHTRAALSRSDRTEAVSVTTGC